MLSSSKLYKSATHQRRNSMGNRGISDRFVGIGNSSLALNDVQIHDTLLTCCPPCSESDRQKLLLDSWTLALETEAITRPQHDLKAFSPMISRFGIQLKDIVSSPKDAQAPEQLYGSDKIFLAANMSTAPDRALKITEVQPEIFEHALRVASSHSSLQSKAYNPSIETSGSKSSAYRHTLLKPSIAVSQPIDVRLLAQPVLSRPIDGVTDTDSLGEHNHFRADHTHGRPLAAPEEVLASLLAPHRGFQLGNTITNHTDNQKTSFRDVAHENLPGPLATSGSLQNQHYTVPTISNGTESKAYSISFPTAKTAFETAVRDAVQQTSCVAPLLSEVPQDETSNTYRRILARSLAEAAQTADEYLKQSSLGDHNISDRGKGTIDQRSYVDTTFNVPSPDCVNDGFVIPTDAASKKYFPVGHNRPHDSYSPLPGILALKSGSTVAETNAVVVAAHLRRTSDENVTPKVLPGLPERQLSADDYKTTYKIVPTRRSSLDRKDQAPKGSSINIPPRKHSLGQRASKATPKPGLKSTISPWKTDAPSLTHIQLSEIVEGDLERAGKSSNESLHWLREVLSKGDPYATRLTALPPRIQRHPRAKYGPILPVRALESPTGTPPSSIRHGGRRALETFTRTIDDLENLLNEALYIARQAAEEENEQNLPNLLNDAVALLQNGTQSFTETSVKKHTHQTGIHRRATRRQLSENTASRDSTSDAIRSKVDSASCHSSSLNIHDGRNPHQEIQLEKIRPSADHAIVVKSVAAPGNLATLPLNHSFQPSVPTTSAEVVQQNIVKSKTFGKSTIVNAITSAIENISNTSRARRALIIRDGNAELVKILPNGGDSQVEPGGGERFEEDRGSKVKVLSAKDLTVSRRVTPVRQSYEEDDPIRKRTKRAAKALLNKREVTEFIKIFHRPPIESRNGSLELGKVVNNEDLPAATTPVEDLTSTPVSSVLLSVRLQQSHAKDSLSSSAGSESEVDFSAPQGFRKHAGPPRENTYVQRYELKDSNDGEDRLPQRHISGHRIHERLRDLKHDKLSHLNLKGRSHISLRGENKFSLSKSHKRQPIARDWSPGRKRFTASVACISTALIGIIIGIYAGEVPSIQYYIADFNHYAILGNVFFFIGLAISTFLFWPLPLLHGRKPYILTAMTIAMPLLFPQAISVSMQRSPYVATWRVGLILPRAIMGIALGFANMNHMATLTDLFGASLQSGNPHQETVDEYDVRRHGGGLGVWLGIWTWSYVGSIGVGFFIGALVINSLSPDWGFYISIVIIAAVLFLNVVTPEVRRSAYRRSVAEVRTSTDVSRRLAKGEVMMHRLQTGPKWWGQEFHQGTLLSLDMIRQPGFLVMSLYIAWMYGQIVLVIVLLGSLMSKYYHFTSPFVGLTTMAIPLGALLAVPFQKASLFSRARRQAQRTDSGTFDRKITFSTHLVRRTIFTLLLPFAGLAYTLSSSGPPTPFILPVLFAGLIGFLSNLAIAECNGIIMETFDTSDLQPGMTGRPRGVSGDRTRDKRTNYSSFPRVSSAFAIIQALGFLIGAVATGIGGVAERSIGQMSATGVMAGILLVLTLLFFGILIRWKEVQIIPSNRQGDMESWQQARQLSFQRQEEASQDRVSLGTPAADEEPWRPVIIGNPSGKTRRMSILELGNMSRWSEIRRKNRLIDEMSYEARHPNLATLNDVRKEIRDRKLGSLRRNGSKRSRRSQLSQGSEEPDMGSFDLGERRAMA